MIQINYIEKGVRAVQIIKTYPVHIKIYVPKVHVECEIHELFTDFTDRENVQGYPNLYINIPILKY